MGACGALEPPSDQSNGQAHMQRDLYLLEIVTEILNRETRSAQVQTGGHFWMNVGASKHSLFQGYFPTDAQTLHLCERTMRNAI
eukprot:4137274-Pyramimonas_sp.AAC.1